MVEVGDEVSKITVLLIRGALSQALPETQARVKECERKIRALIEEYGDDGKFAVALVGAELAAEN